MTALAFKDRVQETAQNIGIGTVTLLGAIGSNFQTFAAAGLNGLTVPYCIEHLTNGQWEVGYGVYTSPNQLTRVVVLSNSSGTTGLINFGAGTVAVWNDLPAEKLVAQDTAGNVTLGGNFTVQGTTSLQGVTGTSASFTTGAFSAAITYGGVTLSNSVTGTGSMVLSASPTLTGTLQTNILTVGQSGANPYQIAMDYNAGQLLIQAQQSGITQAPLYLNPSGGGVSIGGATIGSNALAVTGSSNFGGAVTLTGGGIALTLNASGTANTQLRIIGTNASYGSNILLNASGTDYWSFGRGSGTGSNDFEWYNVGLGAVTAKIANSSGLLTLNYGLTVSSGTTSLQVVTATTGAFSGPVYVGGQVNSEIFGSQLSSNAALGTVVAAGRFSNNGAGYITRIILSDNNTSDANITYSPNNTASLSLLGFGANSNYNVMTLSGTGIVTMSAYGAGAATFNGSGVISSASDERLKHVWGTYGKSMKDIPVNLRNVMIEYGWPDEMGTAYEPLSHYIGQSAQKLQLAVPELVHSKHVLDPKTGKLTDTGRLSVFNPGIDALLWNTAADHESRIAKLEQRMAA